MSQLANDRLTETQKRNNAIRDELLVKESEGFEYGELNGYLHNLAEKHNTTFYIVRNIYYAQVKSPQNVKKVTPSVKSTTSNGQAKNKSSSTTQKDNLHAIHEINGVNVRVVIENNKLYYVAKEVFSAMGVERTAPIIKSNLNEQFKHYVPVKSTHGYAKTLVIPVDGVLNLLYRVLEKHTRTEIRDNCRKFLKALKELGHSVKLSYAELNNLETQKKKTSSNSNSNVYPFNKDSTPKNSHIKTPHYRYGNKVKIKVVSVEDRVVKVETQDDYSVEGIINIRDVRPRYVDPSHLPMYFEKGDILTATVMRYEKDKGKLYLSTVEDKLPLKNSKQNDSTSNSGVKPSLAEQLEPIKEKMETTQTQPSKQLPSETKTPPIEETKAVKPSVLPEIKIDADKSLQRIVSFMNNHIGALSPEAKAELIKVVNENDIVEFTMTMMSVAPQFKADLGLLLVKEISKNIGGYP